METVVLVLMLLVCFSFILKQTYHKNKHVLISSLVCAVFVGMSWPYAIEQSKTQISDWLTNSSLMLDIAVILSIQIVIQMSFCIMAVNVDNNCNKSKNKKLYLYKTLKYFPDLIILPVLFSILVASIFALPGISFSLISWGLAALIFIMLPVSVKLLKHLMPEKEIRLEMLFLTNALMAMLGIIATVNGTTSVEGINNIELQPFIGIVVLMMLGLVCGMILYKIKIIKIIKNKLS